MCGGGSAIVVAVAASRILSVRSARPVCCGDGSGWAASLPERLDCGLELKDAPESPGGEGEDCASDGSGRHSTFGFLHVGQTQSRDLVRMIHAL